MIVWIALFVPIYFVARLGVLRYRATLGEKIRTSRYFKLIEASQVYNVYRWFNP